LLADVLLEERLHADAARHLDVPATRARRTVQFGDAACRAAMKPPWLAEVG